MPDDPNPRDLPAIDPNWASRSPKIVPTLEAVRDRLAAALALVDEDITYVRLHLHPAATEELASYFADPHLEVWREYANRRDDPSESWRWAAERLLLEAGISAAFSGRRPIEEAALRVRDVH